MEKLILHLKNLDLLENSYVIITSDHGEHLCDRSDHYLYGHGVHQSVYESQIKVPLIIFNTKFKKRVIKKQVELRDIFHTILHLIGLSNSKNEVLDINRSIIFQIDNNLTPEYIYGENIKSRKEMEKQIKYNRRFIKSSLIPKILNNVYFVRSNEFKYINFNNKIEEFYDLINDPSEQIDIISDNHEEYNNMKRYLKEHLTSIKNPNNLAKILTGKEKSIIKKAIKDIRI